MKFPKTYVLWAVLAIVAVWMHHLLIGSALPEQRAWHDRIIAGQGPYPDQYRILSYFTVEGVRRLLVAGGVEEAPAFAGASLWVRWFWTFLGGFLLEEYLCLYMLRSRAKMGVAVYYMLLPVTYINYFMQPTDPANLAFIILGLILIEKQTLGLLVGVLVVSILNRETTLLLVPAYIVLCWWRCGPRPALSRGVVLLGVGMLTYFGLRFFYGWRAPYTDLSDPGRAFWFNLHNGEGYFLCLLLCGWLIVGAGLNWPRVPSSLKLILGLWLPLFGAVHLLVGSLQEVRLFLPLLPPLLAAALPWFCGDAAALRPLKVAPPERGEDASLLWPRETEARLTG